MEPVVNYFCNPLLLSCSKHVNVIFNYFRTHKFIDQLCKSLDDTFTSVIQNGFQIVDLVMVDRASEKQKVENGITWYSYQATRAIFTGTYKLDYHLVCVQFPGKKLFLYRDFVAFGSNEKNFEIWFRYPLSEYPVDSLSVKEDNQSAIKDIYYFVGSFVLFETDRTERTHPLVTPKFPHGTKAAILQKIVLHLGLPHTKKGGFLKDKKIQGDGTQLAILEDEAVPTIPGDTIDLAIGDYLHPYQYPGKGLEIIWIENPSVRSITIPAGWFDPSLNFYLTWYDNTQPTIRDIDPVHSRTRIRWGLGAANVGQVNQFWNWLQDRGVLVGPKTLAQLLDPRTNPPDDPNPSILPNSINPAQFLFTHIFPNLGFIIILRNPVYSIFSSESFDNLESKINRIKPSYVVYKLFRNDYNLLPLQIPT